MKRHLYGLKVALADIEPEIWRRFFVTSRRLNFLVSPENKHRIDFAKNVEFLLKH